VPPAGATVPTFSGDTTLLGATNVLQGIFGNAATLASGVVIGGGGANVPTITNLTVGSASVNCNPTISNGAVIVTSLGVYGTSSPWILSTVLNSSTTGVWTVRNSGGSMRFGTTAGVAITTLSLLAGMVPAVGNVVAPTAYDDGTKVGTDAGAAAQLVTDQGIVAGEVENILDDTTLLGNLGTLPKRTVNRTVQVGSVPVMA
jgi:hypothetical protein